MNNEQQRKIIGLTGPIAAGKDEVARILRRRGAFVLDVDKIAHKLYPAQTEVWREIVKTFGCKILNRGGEINRKKLGEIVFADKKKLQQLNEIVHPALKAAIRERLEHREGTIVINAAVLHEIGLVDLVDEVWVVIAPREARLRRLIKSGLTKQEALRRINAQASQKDYLEIADVVIKNDGTLKELRAKIQAYL
jgi:dephospho-CoA kinase